MKRQLLAELGKKHEASHGCYRPKGGPCFYIASDRATADYGRQCGRQFVAASESRDGTLHIGVSLTFLVTKMAQIVRSNVIGDLDQFCREVGLERLRESLDRDPETDRNEDIQLGKDSPDSEFQRPASEVLIRRYQGLKNEMLHLMAARHAKGAKRVPVSAIFEELCEDPTVIDRALEEFVDLGLLRDLNHPEGARLTTEGQRSAEVTLTSVSVEIPSTAIDQDQFDFFISYASEDRDFAEALDAALSSRGFRIWRDRRQLTLGDSLITKINEGLTASRFGIVILSPPFFRKNWPQAELKALQARAIAEGQKVILPIRRDLSHEEMARHLPLLGDKLTIAADQNLKDVVLEIERAAT
jgi:hypothetical protein